MKHPAAFVPSKDAASELRKLAKELRIFVDGKPQNTTPDGTRTVISPASQTAARLLVDRFPAAINGSTLELPELYVDFFDWFYFAPRSFNVPATGIWWLRMVITANCTTTGALFALEPVACTISNPQFEWWQEVLPKPSNETGGAPGVDYDYYFYLVQVTDGVITSRAESSYLVRQPVATPS